MKKKVSSHVNLVEKYFEELFYEVIHNIKLLLYVRIRL